MNDESQTSQDQPAPEEPQTTATPPYPSSEAPSEDTGGSSPEPEAGEEAVEEAAPPAPVEGVAPRPEAGSTNPKTAGPPPPGVPLQPINATRDERSAPTPKRSASRIGEAQERQQALRDESIASD